MQLSRFFIDLRHSDHQIVLLYRFHVVAILVNLFAISIDSYMSRYSNALVEFVSIVILLLSLGYLRRDGKLKRSAYIFILTLSFALSMLIYINHFATMSVVFILLLPLTTLIFLGLKESFFITIFLFIFMSFLLYVEYLNNPANALAQNAQALFNLAYAAIIIYIFSLLYHFSLLRTFKELDLANQQKALLLKEVHHRVKNNLNVIASIVGLQGNRLEGKEKEELLKSKSRIESIAIVHEMLYSHGNFAHINFEIYIQRLTALLLAMYAAHKNINVIIKSNVKDMPLDVMVQLGIMVNELLTNSIKYAFTTAEGEVTVTLHKEEDHYTLSYTDNGIGHEHPEALLESRSLGIKLIHLTAKQLNGRVYLSSPKGLKYEIKFEL